MKDLNRVLNYVSVSGIYWMFVCLVMLVSIIGFFGVGGHYNILLWLAALALILDLFDTAINLAEVGK